MRRNSSDLLIGGLIVAVGVVILLQNLGFFGGAVDLIWALLFCVGGLAFFGVVAQNREHWWALIPGAALFSIGALIGLTTALPIVDPIWGGTIFLGGLGLGFLAVYLLNHEAWWALIPGGVMVTLGLIAGMADRIRGEVSGALLFGGLAVTFALVALAQPGAPRRWALFPAGGLLVMAFVVLLGSSALLNIIWPTLLILVGAGLLYRALTRKERASYEDQTVSQPH